MLLKLNVAGRLLRGGARRAAVGEVADGVGARRRRLRRRERRREAQINLLIPALKDAGATDLLEIPIAKIVH